MSYVGKHRKSKAPQLSHWEHIASCVSVLAGWGVSTGLYWVLTRKTRKQGE